MSADRPPVEIDLSPGIQSFLSIAYQFDRGAGTHTYSMEVRAPDGSPLYNLCSNKIKDRVSLAVLIAEEMAKDPHFGFGRDQRPYRWIGNRWAPVEKWMLSIDYSMHVLARTALNSRESSLTAETMAAWQANSLYPSEGLDLRTFGSCPGVPFEDCISEKSPGAGRVPHHPTHFNLRVLPLTMAAYIHALNSHPEALSMTMDDGTPLLSHSSYLYQDTLLSRFLSSTLNKIQMAQLQRWFGYHLVLSLVPNPEKMMYLWGDGANGKSQLLWLLRGLVGADACAELRLSDLRHSPNIELLAGKIAMIGSEASTNTEIERLKSLISREPLSVNPKYRDPYKLVPECLITQASNHPPRFEEKSNAMARRVVSIHLKNSFYKNEDKIEDIAQKILDDEFPYLVAFAMLGAGFVIDEGGFTVFDEIEEESDAKVSEGNHFEVFAEQLVYGQFEISHMELHKIYVQWCRTVGGRGTPSSLKDLLDELVRIAGKTGRVIKRDARSTNYVQSYWHDQAGKRLAIVPELAESKKPEVVRGFMVNNRNGLAAGQPLPPGSRDAKLFEDA